MAYIEKLPYQITLPDGKKYNLFTSGDEFSNYIHDVWGNKIIQGKGGWYYYAKKYGDEIVPSKHRFNPLHRGKFFKEDVVESAVQYRRRAKRMYDVPELKKDKGVEGFWKKLLKNVGVFTPNSMHLGTLNNIVIFIKFADDPDTFINDTSTYQQKLNGETNSVKDYFNKVSYGKVNVENLLFPEPEGETILGYTDIHPKNYYLPKSDSNPEGYAASERTSREHALLERAIIAVRDSIPEDIELDNTGNGRVDSVSFITRGSHSGWASILWGHRWALFSKNVEINGKRVWDYTFQPETQATVQIVSHELYHVFGSPDLYRYSNRTITPAGPWDLMHSGKGHMTAFMKLKYADGKWVESIPVINEPGRYTLNPMATSGEAYKIISPNSSEEFFILEYRRKDSDMYEANLPGNGLLVYRVNDTLNGNADGPPDELYIYRPDGTLSINGLIHHAHYTDKINRTVISDSTNPRCFLQDDSNGGIKISHIIENSDGTISFNYDYDVNPEVTYYELTTEVEGEGEVTGAGTYAENSEVTLVATFESQYQVHKWIVNDEEVESNENELTITLAQDTHVKVIVGDKKYRVNVQGEYSGGNSNSHKGYFEGEGHYELPATINLTAFPNTGYEFVGWTNWYGDVTNTSPTVTKFYPDEGRNITAVFFAKFQESETEEPNEYTITSEESELYTIDGLGTYVANTTVTLTANIHNTNKYEVDKWIVGEEEFNDTDSIEIVVTENTEVQLHLKVREYTITASINPPNLWKIEGLGTYPYGTDVELIARGAYINHWKYKVNKWTIEDEVIEDVNTVEIENLTSDLHVELDLKLGGFNVEFTSNYPDAVELPEDTTVSYGQKVDANFTILNSDFEFVRWKRNGEHQTSAHSTTIAIFKDSIIECELKNNETMNEKTLTATPNEGYEFVNWTEETPTGEETISSNSQITLELTSDRSVFANFRKLTFTVTGNVIGNGMIEGIGDFEYGENVTLTAVPEVDYKFDGWFINGTLVSEDLEYTFTVTEDVGIEAAFSPIEYELEVTVRPEEGGTVQIS